MKILHTLRLCITFSFVLVSIGNGAALAQDVAAAARANRTRAASATNDSEWYKPTRVSLSEQEQGVTSTSTYDISGNDLKITIETQGKGKHQTAELMLVNGQCQWMLAKNVPLEKGYEIDALDGAVLNLKLVLELLREAAPGGPSQITNKTNFNVQEKSRSITLSTASASGGIEAPWSLQATIEPITAQRLSFELTLKHSETIHFSGTWQKDSTPPVFADDIQLDGWQILAIGFIKTTNADGTILDFGAQVARKHPRTLGELRKISAN